MTRWRSPNFNDRRGPGIVDMLVLHYTGMENARVALERLCDPAAEVSAHWLVEEDGKVHALVDEEKRAWHAGVASWRGEADVNSRSVGIEIVNGGADFGLPSFPDVQIDAVIELCHAVLGRHAVPPGNVVGHSDVAPRRKADPGERFPWRRLADAGIGFWPTPGAPVTDVKAALGAIGYETGDLEATITAFQRRYRPARVDGVVDEETRRILGGF